jgi:hypothetical protein
VTAEPTTSDTPWNILTDTVEEIGNILEEHFPPVIGWIPDAPADEHRCPGLDELDAVDLDLCEALSEHAWADRLVAWWADAARDEAVTRQIFDQGWQQRTAASRAQHSTWHGKRP